MGLDMYLYRKTFLWTGDYVNEEHRDKLTLTTGGKEQDTSKVRYIVEEVGYWRKANQIHKWFVDNIQNGNDDCGEYAVSISKLKELLNICKLIMEEDPGKASILLPTQSGCFFGSTEYHREYFDDLKNTITIIENILSEDKDAEFYYTSSW